MGRPAEPTETALRIIAADRADGERHPLSQRRLASDAPRLRTGRDTGLPGRRPRDSSEDKQTENRPSPDARARIVSGSEAFTIVTFGEKPPDHRERSCKSLLMGHRTIKENRQLAQARQEVRAIGL